MDCKRDQNRSRCTCSYASCPRKGICCDCVSAHLKNRELPGCFFPPAAEKTYDRTFEHFARLVTSGQL